MIHTEIPLFFKTVARMAYESYKRALFIAVISDNAIPERKNISVKIY